MTKNKKITAAILSAAMLVFTAGCSDNSENIDLGENTAHTEATEKLPQTVYGEPKIGGNSILSQDARGDITATLELLNISGLPDGSQENNYYCGQYLIVRIKDGKSGISVTSTLPENNDLFLKLENYTAGGKMRINADCVADSIELLSARDKGKAEYILKVEYIQGPDRRIASFASCDMSEYGENGGQMKWYDVIYDYGSQSTYQYCMVSECFDYKGGNKFVDSRLEKEYEFDTENLQVKISSMDDSDIVFGEPEIGKHSILSQCTLGEYSAAVEIHNITSLPQDNSDRLYWGERLYVELSVKDRVVARGSMPNGFAGGGSQWVNPVGIQEECTGEGATRIFQVEQNGKTHLVLMQYFLYDKEKDAVGAFFACFDPKFYDDYKEREGFDGVLPPQWYSFLGSPMILNKYNGLPISEAFEYVGDGIFRDNGYGYELEFDCENISGKVRLLQE